MKVKTTTVYRLSLLAIRNCIILACCVAPLPLSNCAFGQDDENATMAALANSRTITEWLASKDPRLVAWGAHFAGESSDPDLLNPVIDRLKVAVEDPDLTFRTPYGPDFEANEALLDALIQRKAAMPIDVIRRLRDVFPAQAAVLASLLPQETRTPLLQEWYPGRNYGHNDALARVAAMLLAKAPPTGFAASVLSEAEDRLMIQVILGSGSGGYGEGFGSSSCGDGGVAAARKDWPPLYFYLLEENSRNPTDRVVVEAGGDRVTARRLSASGGFGSCYAVRPLSVEMNHHLLAEMLRTDDAGVPFQTRHTATISWTGKEQFERDLGAAINTENEKLHQAIQFFRDRGLLSSEEAESMLPKLVVSIHFDPAIKH